MLAVLKLKTKLHNWGQSKRLTNQFTLVYRLLGSGDLPTGGLTVNRHDIKTLLLIIFSWPEGMQFEAMWSPHLHEHNHNRRRSGVMLTDLFSSRKLTIVKKF